MKNILLLVHDDAGQEARLQAALDLVRALDGHIHCLDVAMLTPLIDCPYDGLGQALLIEDEYKCEQENKVKLEQRLQHEDERVALVAGDAFVEDVGSYGPHLGDRYGHAWVRPPARGRARTGLRLF